VNTESFTIFKKFLDMGAEQLKEEFIKIFVKFTYYDLFVLKIATIEGDEFEQKVIDLLKGQSKLL